MGVDTVIQGGRVVTESGVRPADVAIDGETIAAVGRPDAMPAADSVVDASGMLVMPGVVDPHVHIDDVFSFDSYESAGRAAALGGTTTYVDFAWQPWDGELSPYDDEETLQDGIDWKLAKGEGALVDWGLHLALTTEDAGALTELPAVIDGGIPSIKLFTAYEIGVGYGFMHEVFGRVADLDGVAVCHTEDAHVCDYLTERFQAEGKGDPAWYPRSRPDYAEAMAAGDACRLAMDQGCRYYGIHTTSRKAADVLARYRRRFGRQFVRAETCTQYTTLDDAIFDRRGHLPMMAPPIRTPDDNDAMFEHLRRGTLDVVSTDHCGYTVESKDVDDWWDSKFGANSLQTSLPVFHDEAVNHRGFSYPFLVRVMCATPARVFGMPWKGTLEPGTDADIVVFDPDETYTITAEDNAGVADFTLYEGREVTGRVVRTYVRGTLVADDGEIVAEPGHGRFVERERPDWDF